jgi:hypothetical protein
MKFQSFKSLAHARLTTYHSWVFSRILLKYQHVILNTNSFEHFSHSSDFIRSLLLSPLCTKHNIKHSSNAANLASFKLKPQAPSTLIRFRGVFVSLEQRYLFPCERRTIRKRICVDVASGNKQHCYIARVNTKRVIG